MIAGGGFVGLRLARLLGKKLKGQAHIRLIDKNERFVFSPWLIDAVAGELETEQYSESYEAAAKRNGFTFVRGEIGGVDQSKKTVEVTTHGNSQQIGYDLFVACQGARPAYYGIQGAEASTQPLKNLEHIDQIHKYIHHFRKQQ